MKVAIIGSRFFKNYSILENYMISWQNTNGKISLIISGGASGTDKLAEEFAENNNIQKEIYLPIFENVIYKAKPFLDRNKKIVENSDSIIAFWDGKSKGTKSTLKYAKKLNKKVFIYII